MPRKRRRRRERRNSEERSSPGDYEERDADVDTEQLDLGDFDAGDGDAGTEGESENDASHVETGDAGSDATDGQADTESVEDDAMELGPRDDAGADVNLGDTSRETIEGEFGIDLDDTYTVEGGGFHSADEGADIQSFEVMHDDTRKEFMAALKDKHGHEAANGALRTLSKRKSSSSPNKRNQRGELMVKRALGVEGEVRNGDGGFHIDGEEVTEEEVAATRDIARVSQAFAREHYANDDGKIQVYRGLREEPADDLLHRTFEHPDETSHTYTTGVTESHAVSPEIAERFDGNAHIEYEADVEDTAFAIDALGRTTMYESEVQMVSKGVEVDASDTEISVGALGFSVDEDVTLGDIRKGVTEPSSMDEEMHKGINKSLKRMAENDRTVNTDRGQEALVEWADHVSTETFDAQFRQKSAKEHVEQVTGRNLD